MGKSNYNINYRCEFKTHDDEKEFFEWEMGRSIKYAKLVILLLGIISFLFCISDYLYISYRNAAVFVITGRTVFLVVCIIYYFLLGKIKNHTLFSYLIALLEIAFIIFIIFVFHEYGSFNFPVQTLVMMVIVIALFIIPNKWVINFFVAVFLEVVFLLFSWFFEKGFSGYDFMAACSYITIAVILCAVFSFNINYVRRINYLTTKRLSQLAITDDMTGIYNKRKFEEEILRCMNYARRYHSPLSMAVFDFDDFKKINDAYGHIFGDTIIINVVQLVKKRIRNTDILSKWGGDEFVLIMPNTSLDNAAILAERLRSTIENYSAGNIKVTCSFGVSQFKDDDDEISFFSRADKFLYMAKKAGKNNVKKG